MEKKTYTILLTSNSKGETKSIVLSAAWFKAAVVLGVIFAVLSASILVDYVSLLLESGENKRIKAENVILRQQFDVVESKVSSLENSLERVKNFSTKLKMITNINDEDRSTKLAMGALPKKGQAYTEFDRKMSGREPASEFLQKDALFLEKIPLNERAGELLRKDRHNYASLSIRIDRAVKHTSLREQGILELWETLSERQSLLNATPSIKPARGWYTSSFGYRIDPFTSKPVMHNGLDIAGPPGTPIRAPANGVVSHVGFEPGYGKLLTIDHGYGVKTRYAHNSQIFVELGQKIKRYDVISAIGNTGRSSGPHLHYEVRVHGVPVDPANYILE
jgi:murein DD-endopeptidase MepM/ murein hydrolase activator NlpD